MKSARLERQMYRKEDNIPPHPSSGSIDSAQDAVERFRYCPSRVSISPSGTAFGVSISPHLRPASWHSGPLRSLWIRVASWLGMQHSSNVRKRLGSRNNSVQKKPASVPSRPDMPSGMPTPPNESRFWQEGLFRILKNLTRACPWHESSWMQISIREPSQTT